MMPVCDDILVSEITIKERLVPDIPHKLKHTHVFSNTAPIYKEVFPRWPQYFL